MGLAHAIAEEQAQLKAVMSGHEATEGVFQGCKAFCQDARVCCSACFSFKLARRDK